MIPIPAYYDKQPLGSAPVDVFSSLLSDRIILLFDAIDDAVACAVIAQLLFLEAKDPEREIRLYIKSPGGSVKAGLAIFDTMRHIRCDVATYCVGEAASMAAVLLAAGARGKRYALPNSTVMIHQALGSIPFSQASDVKLRAEQLFFAQQKLERILSSATGKSAAEIARDTDRDFFLTPQGAKEYGLIDEVIGDEA